MAAHPFDCPDSGCARRSRLADMVLGKTIIKKRSQKTEKTRRGSMKETIPGLSFYFPFKCLIEMTDSGREARPICGVGCVFSMLQGSEAEASGKAPAFRQAYRT